MDFRRAINYSAILWALWWAYWVISARYRVRDTSESSVQRESLAGRLSYSLLTWIGAALMFWPRPVAHLQQSLWPVTTATLVAGLSLQVLGLGFTIWSGRIATGGNQRLIIDGPYRLVRHPIYTGLLAAFFGLALIVDSTRGIVGFFFVTAGFLLKIRREEASVRRHFGSAYEDYARRVPALLPKWPSTNSD